MEENKSEQSYFQQNLAEQVWQDTYKWETDNDFSDTCRRVAKAIASVELSQKEKWEDEFYKLLLSRKYVPAGRVWSNAGTGLANTTLINCFVSGFQGPDQDSIKGIYSELQRQAKILASEGGYGVNFSILRPRGSYVAGIGVETSGVVEFMHLWDTSSTTLTKGSGFKRNKKKGKGKIRKGAMMGMMDIWHPAIEEFITVKSQPGVLSKFNLTVLLNDRFMAAVKAHTSWSLEFPDTEFKHYKKEWTGNIYEWRAKGYPTNVWKTYEDANELWDLITKTTYNRNEPGIAFIDRVNEFNNLSYCESINASNPCLTGDSTVRIRYNAVEEIMTMKDVADAFSQGQEFEVLSFNEKEKITEYKKVQWAGKTKDDTDLLRITDSESGKSIRCTPDHKIYTKNRGWIEAQDLRFDDILKGF